MRRSGQTLAGAIALASALTLAACSAPVPDAPETVGEDYPSGGIPTEVGWPSDWLEAFTSESEAVGGTIVGLRLEYQDDRWAWRVTSRDPQMDWTGERVTDERRGREALIDARDRSLLGDGYVQLPESALAGIEVGTAEAARLSGETYPSPRLVELELGSRNGEPVWRATLMDLDTGRITELAIDALGQGETVPPAKP